MRFLKEPIAVLVAACLISASLPKRVQAAEDSVGPAAKIRSKVEQLGSGAKVRLTLKDGGTITGVVESFDDTGFRLEPTRSANRSKLRYTDVSSLEFAQKNYKTEGTPDAVTVRRTALELGIGRRVEIKTTGAETLHGHITDIRTDELALNQGDRGAMTLPYAQVSAIKGNRSASSTALRVVLIAGACLFGGLAILFAVTGNPNH